MTASAMAGAERRPADWIPVVVERLVSEFRPLRVILFGSQARGETGPDSDIDLLVVLPHVRDKHATMVAMLRTISDLPVSVDVIPTDPEEIKQRGHLVGTILRPALREGRVVYERAKQPASR
ncbi:MAG: nucleotidyltransferase domain-containing protein [Actinomycetota bacterium]